MIRRRIEALENRYRKAGVCPTCGSLVDDGIATIFVTLHSEGEPLGYYYEKPWPDKRRYAYPPDPRPLCPTCDTHVGDMLILTAIYDAGEWVALQKQAAVR